MTRERGQVTVMTIGFLILIGLLTVVVVDASDAYLERQRLAALADGAALAAADGLDESAFYADREIMLDPATANRLVDTYLSDEPVRAIAVSVDDDTVSVHLERRLDLALTPPGWTSSTTIVADATSQLRGSALG